MILDCSVDGEVKVDMIDYVKKMVTEFPQEALQGPKVSTVQAKICSKWTRGVRNLISRECGVVSFLRTQRIISSQERQTGCSAANCILMHKNKRTDKIRLGQVGSSDEVFAADA